MSRPLPVRRLAGVPPSVGPDFHQAAAALARATAVADVITIRNHAEAVRVACGKARAGLTLQNQAAGIRLRAERKAGQLLRDQKRQYKSPGGRPRKNSHHDGQSFRSYAALLQALAVPAITARRFEQDAQIPGGEQGALERNDQPNRTGVAMSPATSGLVPDGSACRWTSAATVRARSSAEMPREA